MGIEIQLGTRVKDSISGFVGTVTAKIEYLYDAPQARVTSNTVTADGAVRDEWFPTARLEAIA